MDNAVQAMMIAFAVMVFVIALSIAVYLITQANQTSQYLAYHADTTRFYDTIDYTDENVKKYNTRYVSAETIIPTLYRYNKENFCIKIYDADGKLVQIFDLNLERKVEAASKKILTLDEQNTPAYAYQSIYDDRTYKLLPGGDETSPTVSGYYLFQAPWIGGPEEVKRRVDLFVNGDIGIINSTTVDYRNNAFYKSLKALYEYKTENPGIADEAIPRDKYCQWTYKEQFISYSYSGEFTENDDGDILITGANSKDKIIIIYTQLKPDEVPGG